MDISGLRRHLPTQAGPRNRELAEKMLRGDTIEGALREDALAQLSTIPEPWLDKLAGENMAYVALGSNETLADTNILWSYSPEALKEKALLAKPVQGRVEAELEAEIAKLQAEHPGSDEAAFAEIGRADALAQKLGTEFDANGIGFSLRVMRGSTPLEFLQNEFNIVDDPSHEYIYPDGSNEEARETNIFTSLLTTLNGEGVLKDGIVDPQNDVLVVPYKMRGEKRVSPVSEKSLDGITGQQMDNNHGVNIWPSRLIVVDDQVVAMPSRKMGLHSVLLHESGHAIDYMAESMPELNHRETMDTLYAEAMKKYEAGDNTFNTSRAMDNVREFFAEAVEAYLTEPLAKSETNFYKIENNHVELKAKNPELFAYVDKLMRWSGNAPAST